uniref:Uncharacterized protein n=1 Tax=Tanacetum cinerariifolium TaxID=118510 RepID=A0A699LA03_TANCI|nr:hypothetical protein [Tanacetum cinerariifolium]
MVRVESLSDDQLTAKMSVLHYMMMSHGGELLAHYRGLNQSHHEYVLSTDNRLKDYEEKSKAKGKERNKKIKSLTKILDNLHAKVARLFADLNRATILEVEKDEEILHLKATPSEFSSFFRSQFQGLLWKFLASDEFSRVKGKLLSLAASARVGLLKHPLVAQTDYAFLNKISKFATKPLSVILQHEPEKLVASSVVAYEQNKEWVNAMVEGLDVEMTDGAAHSKSGGVFMQGSSHVLDDAAEVTMVGSGGVSSGLTDVVVAFSTGENGDGSLPFAIADEEATTNPFGV